MLLSKSKDAQFLNDILNNPEVYPWVSGLADGPLDLTAIVDMPSTLMLKAETGAFLFVKKAPKVLEVHTQFLPGSDQVLDAAKEAADFIFTQTDCKEIITMVPRANKAARILAKAVGFTYTQTDGEWKSPYGMVPLDFFRLTKKQWRKASCPQPQ
jgi:hypothetical protein